MKSEWWTLFNDLETWNERSYAGQEFYSEFHMPRAVFESVLDDLRPRFADKKRGDGKRGARSHPQGQKSGKDV